MEAEMIRSAAERWQQRWEQAMLERAHEVRSMLHR
jgi:hypothetical protein